MTGQSPNHSKEDVQLHDRVATKTEPTFDDILAKAGHIGRWQWQVFFAAAAGTIFNAVHNLSAVFLAITPDHWCRIPDLPSNLSWPVEDIKRYSIPLEQRQGSYRYSSCSYYERNYSLSAMLDAGPVTANETTPTVACGQWQFDTSEYKSTMVTQWDLVCDLQPLVSTVQAIHMFGIMVADVVISSLSDRFGRRTAMLFAITIMIVSTILQSFSPSFILVIAFRFLGAFGSAGNYCCPYVIVTEITGSAKHRAFFGTLYNIPFAIGYMILPIIAYFVRDWSNLQLTLSLPSVLLFAHYWVLPESPRWLTTRGRFDEALKVLKHGARLNGRTLPDDEVMLREMKTFKDNEDRRKCAEQQQHTGRHLVVQLCATSGARNLMFVAYFTWIIVAMVYYGLALNAPKLSSDKYLLFFLGGLVELPAYILTYFLLRYMGRRPSYSGTFLLGGAACLFALLDYPVWLRPTLAITGKFMLTITFTISYLYTAELFPTVVRNVAIGMGSMSARCGSIAAPYIVDQLGTYNEILPLMLFGSLSLAAGLAALLLPETSQSHLPETFRTIQCSILTRCNKPETKQQHCDEEIGIELTETNVPQR